jgi:hypothetical protein
MRQYSEVRATATGENEPHAANGYERPFTSDRAAGNNLANGRGLAQRGH